MTEITHFGVRGMRWGVRKAEPETFVVPTRATLSPSPTSGGTGKVSISKAPLRDPNSKPVKRPRPKSSEIQEARITVREHRQKIYAAHAKLALAKTEKERKVAEKEASEAVLAYASDPSRQIAKRRTAGEKATPIILGLIAARAAMMLATGIYLPGPSVTLNQPGPGADFDSLPPIPMPENA